MTKVKICGIRRIEDARLAVELGAWALGFIFHRPSPRFIAPEQAAALVARLPAGVLKVGVFVDWPLGDLNQVVESAALDAAQLHGRESPEYAGNVRAAEVWKALRVAADFRADLVEEYSNCNRILLDAYAPGRAGGTGETFDWRIAKQVGEMRPLLLAGGIGPDNVERALREVEPEGVDVSSGVEQEPGVKDAEKLRQLFGAVRRHDGTSG